MIPSAEVLCRILNDPAIPAEAKGEYGHTHEWVGGSFGLSTPFGSDFESPERVNADMFWSLSAWLLSKVGPHWKLSMNRIVDPESGDTGTFRVYAAEMNGFSLTSEYALEQSATPLEAIAAVVREVAAQGVKG